MLIVIQIIENKINLFKKILPDLVKKCCHKNVSSKKTKDKTNAHIKWPFFPQRERRFFKIHLPRS